MNAEDKNVTEIHLRGDGLNVLNNMSFGLCYVPTSFQRLMEECIAGIYEKVQVGKDQEKAQSEKDSHSKNRGGKKLN